MAVHPVPPPTALDSALRRLAADIDAELAAEPGPPGSSWLVRVLGPPPGGEGEGEVEVRPLDDHPAMVLTGFVAPAEWQVLGVVAAGSARRVDVPTPTATAERSGRVRLVHLQSRSGASATVVRPTDATARALPLADLGTSAPCGRLADVCRRALGLATQPPQLAPPAWWAAVWLDRVFAEVASAPAQPWPWRRVVALHPLAVLRGPTGDTDLAALVAAADRSGWEDLRRLATRPGGHGVMAPEVAAWYDVGSFARALLADQLPLVTLLDELGALVGGSVLAEIHRLLDRWGLVLR